MKLLFEAVGAGSAFVALSAWYHEDYKAAAALYAVAFVIEYFLHKACMEGGAE